MDADTAGNSILHLCVLNNLPALYTHLIQTYGLDQFMLNNANLTPLQLAARLGKV
jgi:hypothetical protein